MPFLLIQDAGVPAAPAIEVSTAALAAFIGYLALMIGIGIRSARASSGGLADFFLGGRRMNRVVVALKGSGPVAVTDTGFEGAIDIAREKRLDGCQPARGLQ